MPPGSANAVKLSVGWSRNSSNAAPRHHRPRSSQPMSVSLGGFLCQPPLAGETMLAASQVAPDSLEEASVKVLWAGLAVPDPTRSRIGIQLAADPGNLTAVKASKGRGGI
jgi:hypothetical protein